jgi:hypothetical protein
MSADSSALNEQAAFKQSLTSIELARKYDGDIFGNNGSPYRIAPSRNFGGWYDRQHRDSRRYELLRFTALRRRNGTAHTR